MRRREFITLLGVSAAASSISRSAPSLAQQGAAPVVGFLSGASAAGFTGPADAFRKGLSQGGAVDGQNITIEYRWAENQYDRLPALAAELVRQQVAVLFGAGGDASAQAAKAATATIPVVIIFGGDPVAAGIVTSLNRPGGNVTGMTLALALLEQKRLELLHEMVPLTRTIAVMMNPTNPRLQSDKASIEAAAKKLGLGVSIVYASDPNEFEAAVNSAARARAGALHVASDPLFVGALDRLVPVTARYAIPAMYQAREQVRAGGLMSYGTPLTEVYRQAGIYVARILKGAKPADLPILQPTKYELHINLKTAKSLGLEVPTSLLLLAEEVIE
jgi:putative ABC transport system substrate-binding protein